ncbi:MAG TPA: Nif3-like dinuclear metal center hexameric protein, partial [Rhodoglobus sp.]|nr:Nif3-like dinuclear metal center hexameric protein [Rhodoglobus sp.]
MSPTLADVAAVVERLWPASGAEPWDAVGLIAGDPAAHVDSILLAVDAVHDTVDEAVASGADLLLVHHPLLLRGVTSVAADRYKGAALTRLIRAEIALLAAHTNADVVESGTSATLASALGLVDITPLAPSSDPARGIGRLGRLPVPMTLGRLARTLGELLPATATGIR